MPTDTSERGLEALICTDENFRLLERLPSVTCWSRPDEFKQVLSKAV